MNRLSQTKTVATVVLIKTGTEILDICTNREFWRDIIATTQVPVTHIMQSQMLCVSQQMKHISRHFFKLKQIRFIMQGNLLWGKPETLLFKSALKLEFPLLEY
jgi:hypothetical protein